MPSVRYAPSGRPICRKHRLDTCPTLSDNARAAGIEEYISFLEFLKQEIPHFVPHGCSKTSNAFFLFRSKYCHESAMEIDQRDISKAAADRWNDMSPKEKEPFERWYKQLKKIERALSPDPPTDNSPMTNKNRKATTTRSPKLSLSSTSRAHPYPSPPMSDGDDEYSPRKPSTSRRRTPTRRTTPKPLAPRLLTPPPETEELVPAEGPKPPSPTLVPNCPLLPCVPSSPALGLTLNELNLPLPDTCLYALPYLPCHHDDFYDQQVVGYAPEEDQYNTIIDWDQPSLFLYDYHPSNVLQSGSTEAIVDHTSLNFETGGL